MGHYRLPGRCADQCRLLALDCGAPRLGSGYFPGKFFWAFQSQIRLRSATIAEHHGKCEQLVKKHETAPKTGFLPTRFSVWRNFLFSQSHNKYPGWGSCSYCSLHLEVQGYIHSTSPFSPSPITASHLRVYSPVCMDVCLGRGLQRARQQKQA